MLPVRLPTVTRCGLGSGLIKQWLDEQDAGEREQIRDVIADNRPFSPGAIPHGGRYSIIRTALRLAAHYGGASAVESSAHETSRVTTLPFSPRWLTKRRSFDQPSAAPIDSTNLRSESAMKSSQPRKLQARCKIDRRRRQRAPRDDMNGFDLDLHASQRLIARCCADRHTQS